MDYKRLITVIVVFAFFVMFYLTGLRDGKHEYEYKVLQIQQKAELQRTRDSLEIDVLRNQVVAALMKADTSSRPLKGLRMRWDIK